MPANLLYAGRCVSCLGLSFDLIIHLHSHYAIFLPSWLRLARIIEHAGKVPVLIYSAVADFQAIAIAIMSLRYIDQHMSLAC